MLTQREIDEMEYRAARAREMVDEVERDLRGPVLDEEWAMFFVRLLAACVLIAFVYRLL